MSHPTGRRRRTALALACLAALVAAGCGSGDAKHATHRGEQHAAAALRGA